MQQDENWQKAWNEGEEMDAFKKHALLDNIHRRINAQRRKKQLFFIGSCAAAAILIVLFIRTPLINAGIQDKWQEMASNDLPRRIILEDSTVLWLAPHSIIRVHADFTKQRSTVLTKGIACFSVAKDEAHVFSTTVNRQQVTVLGTAFTVRRLDSIDLRLTVKEGKVALNNAGGRQLLTAGQQVSTVFGNTKDIQPIDPADTDWWTQKQVRWHDVSLEDLLRRIEDYYQTELSYGPIDGKMKLTLTWDLTQPLNDNLAVLNSLTGYNIH